MKNLILISVLILSFTPPAFADYLGDTPAERRNYFEQQEQTRTMKRSLALQKEAMEQAEEQATKDRYRQDLDDMRKAFGY